MNVSNPVASSISSVDFGLYSTEEIKALSVKRIQCSTTFDKLLHPVPGGLYDTALGAWGDNPCATCHLSSFACPGHPGHIELPVPVYHATFMSEAYRLLRAKCAHCHYFRMKPVDINRYICKLRLIHYGLLPQADEIDDIVISKRDKAADANGHGGDASDESSEESADEGNIIPRRITFVNHCIRQKGSSLKPGSYARGKTESMTAKRASVVKDFLATMGKGQKCARCGSVSPKYQKDKFVKIFELVSGNHAKQMNPAVILNRQRQAQKKRRNVDEGIVADVHDSEADESTESSDSDVPLAPALPERRRGRGTKAGPVAQRYVDAGEVYAALTLLFEKEGEILNLVYNCQTSPKTRSAISADMFFIRCLLVPPTRYRPEARTGDGEVTEAAQNTQYKTILNNCDTINHIYMDMKALHVNGDAPDSGRRRRNKGDLYEAWIRLQEAVNSLLDRDRNSTQGAASRMGDDGIKQKLEKKEGLFRKNMMGKRVNFAARSVISPDPNIEPNEVGIPPMFAQKLTYPEPVTNHNYFEMKSAVINGMEKWPGAAAIENENGQVISLRAKNSDEREALANQLLAPSSTNSMGARNKKVHRHLNNGDIVLMNRQPTLHKPSIMGHRARVLPGEKTIRLHYANCNTYNADFDGDEMNLHFPQNELARAEALQIADTDHQYLAATSGKPLRGLIQDHLSMGVHMTSRDTFFDRSHYQQLLYSCLAPENGHTSSDRIVTVEPAVIKPRPLWTGKQVISTILKNITPVTHPGLTLQSKSTAPSDRWGPGSEEGDVWVKDGELLCGILDKAQLGPSAGGLIHSVHEAYGHVIAGKLIGIMGRLLTKFLHMRAFSCGVEDLVLTKEGERARKEKLADAARIGLEVAATYVKIEDYVPRRDSVELRSRLEDVFRSEEKHAGLDLVVNSRTRILSSEVTKACLPVGLAKPFPLNQMQTMTASGAKGSLVNANLISCNLGQQILEGRRVPVMISGKTLPCFKPLETDIRAGGYVTDRFLTGIRPQEYFFHCMAGREGLIDTAVKTSRSGYLQRCLVKGLEGLRVEYDNSVRDADGSMVQFLYGEDGLDVTKQKHLTDFKFIAENFFSHVAQLNVREEFRLVANDDALEWAKSALKKFDKTGKLDVMDPVLAHFTPSRYIYSTSETFARALKKYTKENPDKLLRKDKKGSSPLSRKNFEMLLYLKYLKSIIEPGETVGIIAGQSIGEPSTQMTLNTFHLAGHAAQNVTLGIPRLREIVMTASSNISTPVMTLPFRPDLSEKKRERFAKAISKLSLGDIIENVTVDERVGAGVGHSLAKIYDIKLDFFPSREYCGEYAVTVEDIANALERKFAPRLQKNIRAELARRGGQKLAGPAEANDDAIPQIGLSAGPIEEASGPAADDEGHDVDDDNDETANVKASREAQVTYTAGDDEDGDAAEPASREASPDVDMRDEGIGTSPEPESEDDDRGSVARSKPAKGARAGRVMDANRDFAEFKFDEKNGHWCHMRLEYPAESPKILVLSLVESACHSAVIHAISGIGSCALSTAKRRDAASGAEAEEPVAVTQGVNVAAMQQFAAELDVDRLSTNDIHSMLRFYGVESCRATIIREMDTVFRSHGITVDQRHINLIADAMTRAGTFQPFSRRGIQCSSSPLLKMSFETTTAFLRDAVLDADRDELLSPSARLVVGKVSRAGTGAFDVMMPLRRSEG